MTQSRLRTWLLAACVAALLPLAWRTGELVDELLQERLAAVAYQRATTLAVQGRFPEAAAAFRQVIEISPAATQAYVDLAEAEFRRGRFDDAIEAYRHVIAIYPYTYYANLYWGVGRIELRAGRLVDARRDFLQAVTIDPDRWDVYYLLGHVYARLGNVTEAKSAWEKVVFLNPSFRPVYEDLRKLTTPNS